PGSLRRAGAPPGLQNSPPLAGRDENVSTQSHIDRGFAQFDIEAALVEFSDQRSLEFVAFVEERDSEGKAQIIEYLGVLRPGDDRARAHHRREIAVGEGVAR